MLAAMLSLKMTKRLKKTKSHTRQKVKKEQMKPFHNPSKFNPTSQTPFQSGVFCSLQEVNFCRIFFKWKFQSSTFKDFNRKYIDYIGTFGNPCTIHLHVQIICKVIGVWVDTEKIFVLLQNYNLTKQIFSKKAVCYNNVNVAFCKQQRLPRSFTDN